MKFFRSLGLVLMLFPLFTVAAATATASGATAPPVQVIYPTGEFPADVVAVQTAVDRGGTLLLKATDENGVPTAFNFGTPEPAPNRGVSLTVDVAVLGEEVAGNRTTIDGGVVPFRGFGPKIATTISGIDFQSPFLSAIIITRSNGAEISMNRITDVQGTPGFPSEGRGIKFLGNSDPANAITGEIAVRDNVIQDMHADLSDAIVFDAVAADVKIDGNRITTVQSSGILIIDSSGRVEITDNYIEPGPGDPGEFSFGNGLSIVGGDTPEIGKYIVTGNEIICENQSADGLVLRGAPAPGISGAIVSKNQIVMHDSFFGALTFVGGVSDTLVGQNNIRGNGGLAIDILQSFTDPELVADSNTYVGNNITTFDSELVDVYLGPKTKHTVLVGHSGSVIDFGEDNQITGFTPMGQANIGQQIADAMAMKRQSMTAGSTGNGFD